MTEAPLNTAEAESRPSAAGTVFDAGFNGPADGDANQVADPFKPHGDWDFGARFTDFDYSLPTGYQRLTILERSTNPIPGTSLDQPGGARLEGQRCKVTSPCDKGGDAGIHRVFRTGDGDTWHAEAWVKLDSDVLRVAPDSFKTRVTIHYYDINGTYVAECAPNGVMYLNDPTGATTHIETVCTVPPNPGAPIKYVRVNVRAHADKDQNYPTNEMAGASGSVLVDRFKLSLVSRGL